MDSSNDYAELVSLFQEFRESLKPEVINGVPDYTAAAMEEKHRRVKKLQDRLAAIGISGWPVSQQVDYHVVRAEMNGVDFELRVLRPWARDPGFYNISDGMYPRLNVHYTRMLSGWPLQAPELPLQAGKLAEFRMKLQAIPKLYEQAKGNLTEGAGALAIIAIRVKEKEISFMSDLTAQLAEHHPDLVPDTEQALAAVEDFRDWLEENKDKMTAPAGIGKENYNWWLKNVQLIPYTWDECLTIIESEHNRVIALLKIEEHKNRKLPKFKLTASEEENLRRQKEAAEELLEFLRDEEIITVPGDLRALPPERYPRTWGISAYLRPGACDFFEQCCDREPMTLIAHTFSAIIMSTTGQSGTRRETADLSVGLYASLICMRPVPRAWLLA